MRQGKLNWDVLSDIIKDNKGYERDEVIVHSTIGEDCSIVDLGGYDLAISTDPITGASKGIGKLAVNINCNDIAACGGEPLGIMVTVLIPPSCSIDEIKEVMNDLSNEARRLKVEVIGGHTEVTDAVNRVVVSATVIGKVKKGNSINSSGASIGDDIIVTKDLCLEGSSIVANEYEEKLKSRLSKLEIDELKGYSKFISVVDEGIICSSLDVSSMHDITEGGVLGALWEITTAANVGFRVNKDLMPITGSSNKLCDICNIDPLKFISSGSMLICSKNGENVKRVLEDKGIKASIIGKITNSNGILVVDGKDIEVLPPEADELYSVKL